MKQRGFTVIELLIVIVVLIIISVVFWTQKNNVQVAARDDQRKIAINAMYYSLEEVFYPRNGYYPQKLTPETLPSVDKELFKDPNGVMISKADSDYRYEPARCLNEKCQSYTLRAFLKNEADYIKKNRQHAN